MKELLNEQICQWLKSYRNASDDRQVHKITRELLYSIPLATSLKALREALCNYTQVTKDTGTKQTYGPINLYSGLKDWQKAVQ